MSRNQATAVLRDNADDLKSYLVPALTNAREVVTPALVTAGARARDVVVEEVLPRVKDGLAATEPLRHEAASRATAAAHALAGHTTAAPKSRHLGRKAVMVTLIGAGAAAAWRAWKLPHDSDDWTSADSASPGNGNAAPAPAPPTHV